MKKIKPLQQDQQQDGSEQPLKKLQASDEASPVGAQADEAGNWNQPGGMACQAGGEPQRLVDKTIRAVRCSELRDFIEAVFAEKEIGLLLSRRRGTTWKQPDHEIAYLRRAGAYATFWNVRGREEREALYVATLLAGIRQLLAPSVVGTSTVDDVLKTTVRRALRHLRNAAPRQAGLIELCLGWDDGDAIDHVYCHPLRRAIEHALDSAGQHGLIQQGFKKLQPN